MNSDFLKIILNSNDCTLPLLLSLLNPDDIESLYVGTMNLFNNPLSSRLILNCIYYNRYLAFDHSFNLTWGYQPENCFPDSAAYGRTIVSSPNLDLTATKHRAEQIRNALTTTMQNFLNQERSDTAQMIVSDIYESLKEGPLLLPHLRRQCIGMNSNTPLQYYYADQLTQDQPEYNQQTLYEPLRQARIDFEEKIVKSAQMEKPLLLKLRFQSQLTTIFEPSQSEFINLINLIVLATDTHVESIYALVKAETEPLQRMIYFVSHYVNFRQSVLALNDKLGFLFEEFQVIFQSAYPECYQLSNPHFSIVNIMLKKWYSKMKEFHQQFAHIYSYLLVSLREKILRDVLCPKKQDLSHQVNPCSLKASPCSSQMKKNTIEQEFSHQVILCALKASPFSSHLPIDAHLRKSSNFKEIVNHNEAARHVLHHYTEYLVDLSVNEISVHFNDHSDQIMGVPYRLAEQILIKDTLSFYSHIHGSIHNLPVLKFLIEKDFRVLKTITKPVTIKKILASTNQLLKNLKQKAILECTAKDIPEPFAVVIDLSKSNRLIESMAENLKLPNEMPDGLQVLYDLTATIDLEKLKKQYFDVNDSQIDRNELDSYRSDNQDMEEFQPVNTAMAMEIEEDVKEHKGMEESTMSIQKTAESHDAIDHDFEKHFTLNVSSICAEGDKTRIEKLVYPPTK